MENCVENISVTNHVMRKVPFGMRATDFAEVPGKGKSFWGNGPVETERYRGTTGMRIIEVQEEKEKRFYFDCRWDRYGLLLQAEEFASYYVNANQEFTVEASLKAGNSGALTIGWQDGDMQEVQIKEGETFFRVKLPEGRGLIQIGGVNGQVCLEHLTFYYE